MYMNSKVKKGTIRTSMSDFGWRHSVHENGFTSENPMICFPMADTVWKINVVYATSVMFV
jgi:hypothetical protein